MGTTGAPTAKPTGGTNAPHKLTSRRHPGVRSQPARLRDLAFSGNGDRADDLVQETLLRALANIDSFQPGSNLPAWLFTILRNLFRSDYRKRRREVEDADGSYAKTLKTQPAQQRASGVRGIPRRTRQASPGPARSADSGRRLRLLLRGRRGDLRLRGRHHQEPRQPGAIETLGAALCRRRRRFRPRSKPCAP